MIETLEDLVGLLAQRGGEVRVRNEGGRVRVVLALTDGEHVAYSGEAMIPKRELMVSKLGLKGVLANELRYLATKADNAVGG